MKKILHFDTHNFQNNFYYFNFGKIRFNKNMWIGTSHFFL
jgi:hypothetical protein